MALTSVFYIHSWTTLGFRQARHLCKYVQEPKLRRVIADLSSKLIFTFVLVLPCSLLNADFSTTFIYPRLSSQFCHKWKCSYEIVLKYVSDWNNWDNGSLVQHGPRACDLLHHIPHHFPSFFLSYGSSCENCACNWKEFHYDYCSLIAYILVTLIV